MDNLISNNSSTEFDNQYEVSPYRISYSMSTSEVGLIVLMIGLIFITLILICIASNLKSNFKEKMESLGVVLVNVNGEKQICINNHLNTMFTPVDLNQHLRTTSFMNVNLPSEYVF